MKKKQKNKKTGKERVITKLVEVESFFNVFESMDAKNVGQDDDEEDADDLLDKLDRSMDIITMIAEEGLPYSLAYYLGVVEGEEGDDEDFDDEDDEDDFDEDEGASKKVKAISRKKKSSVEDDKK